MSMLVSALRIVKLVMVHVGAVMCMRMPSPVPCMRVVLRVSPVRKIVLLTVRYSV